MFLDTNVLEGFDLSSVDFSRCTLKGARFWSVANLVHSNFTDCDLRGANFSDCNLGVCMTNADVSGAIFQNVKMGGLCGEAKNLGEARYINVAFAGSSWSKLKFTGVKFRKCDFRKSEMINVLFDDCTFENCSYSKGKFVDCVFKNSNLRGEDLSYIVLRRARFVGNTDLAHARLNNADLSGSDLLGAAIHSSTVLLGARVVGCKIRRRQLERLSDYGGLTKGDRMDMDVQDPVARLRSAYSGFWQWFHIIALAIFLSPYLWFLAEQWSVARFNEVEASASVTLGEALARYIYNGGVDWQSGFSFHVSFVSFLVLMVYNVIRAVFLWKTKQLELDEQARGTPVDFNLDEIRFGWGWWFKWHRRLGYGYLLIGVANLCHFLLMKVSV
jgi:uncharacterized protein YjbI with pentapeptide repeats